MYMVLLGDNFPWASCFCTSCAWGTNYSLFRTDFWKNKSFSLQSKGQSCLLFSKLKIMSPFEQCACWLIVYYKRFGFPYLRVHLLQCDVLCGLAFICTHLCYPCGIWKARGTDKNMLLMPLAMLWVIKSFVSHAGISGLLLASIQLY